MSKENNQSKLIKVLIEDIELTDSIYEQAKKRYEKLGEWFGREESKVDNYNPHVFSQGSFRLGTVNKPLNDDEHYDLDIVCKLKQDIYCNTHTQEELKNLVGNELKKYRKSMGIKDEVVSKHRCWRINYQDEISFHIDIIPAIPANKSRINNIRESINKFFEDNKFNDLADKTIFITDDRDENYKTISNNWEISNPEGYAEWFENRSHYNKLEERQIKTAAEVDDLPFYKEKTPLQRVVKLLKRHRDNMFKNNEVSKPISIIITTLAAYAYKGEQNLKHALNTVLNNMDNFINPDKPRVPNPVDPDEDFADKWSMQEYNDLKLEKNFYKWLYQAQADFENYLTAATLEESENIALKSFGAKVDSLQIDFESSTKKTMLIDNGPKPWVD